MTLAIIPARGGSKRLPHKNAALFNGRSLVEWAISSAMESSAVSRILVSTDDEGIAATARRAGADVPFIRPPHLSSDTASSLDVVLHALSYAPNEDTIVLLQPTSPLRTGSDIADSLELHRTTGRPVVSVTPVPHQPFYFDVESKTLIPTKQEWQMVVPNGAIYIDSAASLMRGGSWWNGPIGHLMPAERSIDIDTEADWKMASALFTRSHSLSAEQAERLFT